MKRDFDAVRAAGLERIEELAAYLLPQGKRVGNRLLVGDATGAPGKSFSIVLTGERAGLHGDFASGERMSSSPIDLWAARFGCTVEEACDQLAAWLGMSPTQRRMLHFAPPAPQKPAEPAPVPPMPAEVSAVLGEGFGFACGSDKALQRIAEWRAWSIEATRYAAACGVFAVPLVRGRRVVAFPVHAPAFSALCVPGEDQRLVGFHYRAFPSAESTKAPWFFAPSQREHGHSIPPLPLVLGRFSTARTLIIVEGEWDAVSLAVAEDWLQDGAWPEGVCVLGIRGVSGTKTFLDHFLPFWPREAQALLVCDNDQAGLRWRESRQGAVSFLEQIRRRGTEAAAITVNQPAKDLNDALRTGQWPAGTVWSALRAHKMEAAA